ncbi:MAG: glutamyl-tRNA reductase [gamma proteobacterium symbiont of Bathyaustriella thionipta]|nr:glutamyl-tRNA reductase [gamma proteobacterium symbiont of Bathyaustriella thionipta]
MNLIALGLNHQTAPVDFRERTAFAPDVIGDALRNLQARDYISEAAILSTCNRTEIYCAVTHDDGAADVEKWMGSFHDIEQKQLSPYLYLHRDNEAVQHLFRVACGLDSMVLGEPQILGQVKMAYQTATAATTTGKLLRRLFQHTFAVAKQVRTDTSIGNSPVSVAFAAVDMARRIFSDLSRQTVLLVGAGETIELAARHLQQQGIGRIIVANRTLERAQQLANHFNGSAITLTDMSSHLAEADMVISSTASPIPVLGKGAVERALKARRHQPMLMIDIAVPRDIEPEVADLNDIYLYTVDDLKEVIQENLASRREAAEQAEEIISRETDSFAAWVRSLDAITLIQDYRGQATSTRDEVLQRALRLLNNGKSAEEALRFLAHTLTNKLLHTPSEQIRKAGANGETELLQAANALLHNKKNSSQ